MGYWEPHSSSVDFCEPNYLTSNYVAEFHNSWSSLFFILVALIGYYNGNPMKEWRVSLLFLILTVIGVGSCALHGSLHWIWQSSDEVPMLWMCLALLFSLVNHQSKVGESTKMSEMIFLFFGFVLTTIYYTFQDTYTIFLATYTVLVTAIISRSIYLVFESKDPEIASIRRTIYGLSFFYYMVIGFVLWVYEMNNCPFLEPYYVRAHGFTFHILWHFGAGMGTYFQVTYFIILRLQALKKDFKLRWLMGGLLPVCQLVSPGEMKESHME